jgi:hypothetical protein
MNFDIIAEQLAKGMSLKEIADKHSKKITDLKQELKKGAKTEKEHTTSTQKAKSIAKDHLVEDPKYYTKIKKAGL